MPGFSVKSILFRGLGWGRRLLTDNQQVLNSVSTIPVITDAGRNHGAARPDLDWGWFNTADDN
jgi:hypothetical protein